MPESTSERLTFIVRPAEKRDAAAIAEIYNQGIRQRIATFETEERSVEERERWLEAHDEHHPCLVAVDTGNDRVAGWVSADHYRSRQCYRGIAEFSVYVHEDYRGHGVGRILMETFIPVCEAVGSGSWSHASFPRIWPAGPSVSVSASARSAPTRSMPSSMASGRTSSSLNGSCPAR